MTLCTTAPGGLATIVPSAGSPDSSIVLPVPALEPRSSLGQGLQGTLHDPYPDPSTSVVRQPRTLALELSSPGPAGLRPCRRHRPARRLRRWWRRRLFDAAGHPYRLRHDL